jgi:hypothetical protein
MVQIFIHRIKKCDGCIRTRQTWLDKCTQLRRLDFNSRYRIRKGIKGAVEGYLPVAFDKLKEENPELYQIISENIT